MVKEELTIKNHTMLINFREQQGIQGLFDALIVALTFEYGDANYSIKGSSIHITFYKWEQRPAVILYAFYNRDNDKIIRFLIDTDKVEGKNYYYDSDTMGFKVFPLKIKELLKELSEEERE